MALSVKQVTKSKLLRTLLKERLSLMSNAKLVRGGKHCALLIGRRKLPIPSTPSGNEKKLVLNFRIQLKKLMVSEGLSILGI